MKITVNLLVIRLVIPITSMLANQLFAPAVTESPMEGGAVTASVYGKREHMTMYPVLTMVVDLSAPLLVSTLSIMQLCLLCESCA